MLKQDWLEYFEAVNGRSATDAEIAQALLAGEFVEPEVASAHQVGSETGSIISDSVPAQGGASNGEYYAQPQNSFQEQNGQASSTQPTGQRARCGKRRCRQSCRDTPRQRGRAVPAIAATPRCPPAIRHPYGG